MSQPWPYQPLKSVTTINDEALGEGTSPDYELQYIDIGNVDSFGRIHDLEHYRFEDAPSRARRIVRHGDVIISTVRTYLQAIAPIEYPPDNLIVSTGFAVIRPRNDKLYSGYCKYALRESSFIHEVITRSVGISYPAITATDLADILIHIPPLPTQYTIAAYLDRETAKIDALIDVKQRMMGLLAEKRRAIVTHAVMRGLDAGVPMRGSGVEWIGEIPEHWNVETAGRLFCEIDQRSPSGEEELLTVSHLTGVTRRSEKDVNMFMAESNEGYKLCQAGDLVINTLWAWMGAMGVAFEDGIVSPAYNVYRPNPHYDPAYIDILVRIPIFAQEVTRYSKGVWSSRLRLYPDEFFQVMLPVPPLVEQQYIAEYIRKEIQKIDQLSTATQNTIEILQERRQALITEAVTGQLQVGE